jgi:hypothetical protein
MPTLGCQHVYRMGSCSARVRRALLSAVGLVLLSTSTAHAWQTRVVSDQSTGGDSVIIPRPAWPMLTQKARDQIAALEQSLAEVSTPPAAAAAGFQPALGVIPTMGEHWVNFQRMMDKVDPLQPEQLMFSPVGGKMRLVGVAYAFVGEVADAPDLFDGDQDTWHAHPEFQFDFAPGALVMLHVWFVPSPDGPFAGHDPLLPYWAAGMQPTVDSLPSEPASAARARRLGLALSEALAPMPLLPMYDSAFVAPAQVQPLRESLLAAIPRLNAARRAGDPTSWDREADSAITVWQQVRDAYVAAIPNATERQALADFYQEMETGGHAHMQAHVHDAAHAHKP